MCCSSNGYIYLIYSVCIVAYNLPWEDKNFAYPKNFAPPLQIAIEASNGASDYGNKFGEPVILGFARSFGLQFDDGERREWIKPIMFSGGIGSIEDEHLNKLQPAKGTLREETLLEETFMSFVFSTNVQKDYSAKFPRL